MSDLETIPELKQILGAVLFAAKEPVSLSQFKHVFEQTGEQYGGITKDFVEVTDDLLLEALEALKQDLANQSVGLHVREVANGYRLANDANCGPWLRVLLEKGKANRLSRPALETLAIIAYRQPVVRSEIEAVRGVAVDQIIRNLLDMQLIRVVGRSDLPGRPWLFGTTQKFLEHFGVNSLNDLPGTDELRRLEAEQLKRQEPPGKDGGEQSEWALEAEPNQEQAGEAEQQEAGSPMPAKDTNREQPDDPNDEAEQQREPQ